jgi:hypothetical protein
MLKTAILNYLADGEYRSAMEIGSWLGITTRQANALCTVLVGERKLVREVRANIFSHTEVKVYALPR